MSRVTIFEGLDADAALTTAPVKKTRRGYKRGKTSPKQEARQKVFKTCVVSCKGTGKYRVCMKDCLSSKSAAPAMAGAKRRRR